MVDTSEISVASLNTMGVPGRSPKLHERTRLIADYFNNSSIDVVQLQEIFTHGHLNILRDQLRTYPTIIYDRALMGPRGGLVTFSRIPLSGVTFTPFTRVSRQLLWPMAKYVLERGMLQASLREIGVTLVNTHLSAVKDGNWTASGRYTSQLAHEIVDVHQKLRALPPDTTAILTGDFNLAKDSEYYESLLDLTGLNDAFKADDAPTFHDTFLPKDQQSHCIDYILIYDREKPGSFTNATRIFSGPATDNEGHTIYVSDHIGLKATVRLNR